MTTIQRTAVLTGATSERGIGLTTARRYAAQGWGVVILDLDGEKSAKVAAEIGNPASFVLHYDITTVYRYGLSGYENDPALRLLRLARNIQVVFVCPDAERLFTQFTGRDARPRGGSERRSAGPARS